MVMAENQKGKGVKSTIGVLGALASIISSGGLPFARVVNTATTSSLAAANRDDPER